MSKRYVNTYTDRDGVKHYPTPAIDKLTEIDAVDPDLDELIIHDNSQNEGQREKRVKSSKLWPMRARTILGRLKSSGGPQVIKPEQMLATADRAGFMSADDKASIGYRGLRNLLINGGFFINQRVYVSGTNTTVANQYTLDRWRVVTSGQNLTFADSNGTRTVTAPAGGIEQVIEGTWLQAGDYVISWTGTATCTVGGVAKTSGATVTLTGGSNVAVKFSTGTVSNAQFEPGTVESEFEQRPVGMELGLCQRYYYKNWSSSDDYISYSRAHATVRLHGLCPFLVQMRTTPTVTVYSYDGTEGRVSNEFDGNTYAATGCFAEQLNERGFSRVTKTGGTDFVVGSWYVIKYIADAEL